MLLIHYYSTAKNNLVQLNFYGLTWAQAQTQITTAAGLGKIERLVWNGHI